MNSDADYGDPPVSSHTKTAPPASEPSLPINPPQIPEQTLAPIEPRYASRTSIASSYASTRSRREYMDSLVVPSRQEMAHISQVQMDREAEHKQQQRQRAREVQRRSAESARETPVPPPVTSRRHLPRRFGLHGRHGEVAGDEKAGGHDDVGSSERYVWAVVTIQRIYRGYRVRRQMRGLAIDPSTRWIHAIRDAQWRHFTQPRPHSGLFEDKSGESVGHSAGSDESKAGEAAKLRSMKAQMNWRKVAAIARRVVEDMDGDSEEDKDEGSDAASEGEPSESAKSGSCQSQHCDATESGIQDQKLTARQRRDEALMRRRKDAKMLDLQYFLEMVDLKHRYGANLRVYHEEWKKADTDENFFYWLDHGEGRFLDIAACPREQLDREQVRYLSREERQYYLVRVDGEGRLCWAKNGARIDTTERWKDSIHGIVPPDDPTPAFHPTVGNLAHSLGKSAPRLSSSSADSDGDDGNRRDHGEESNTAHAANYVTPEFDRVKGMHKVHHISAATIFNKLLRKSVQKNTWIFVADTNFRLYVGIKASGAFQHSSFLQGSRISAAGIIRIQDGKLASLSPLSGHYRPPASNFRAFVHSLRDAGVDMRHVSISKSYVILVGLEVYIKARQRGRELLHGGAHGHDKLAHSAEAHGYDGCEMAAEQRRREEREREENRIGVRLMQKLHITPQEPAGQKGGGDMDKMNATAETVDAAR